MTRLRRRDEALRERNAPDSTAELMDELEALQAEKRSYAEAVRAFSFLQDPEYSSATLRRALLAQRAMNESLPPLMAQRLEDVPAQPEALDAALLADHLRNMQEHLDADSAFGRVTDLAEEAPRIVQQTVLSDPEETRSAMRNRAVPDDDPILRIAAAVYDQYQAFWTEWSALQDRERRLTRRLGRLRHRQADPAVALPRSRSPRITDGRVQGYPSNGTVAPPFTTFFGLYGHHTASSETQLSDRWRTPVASFERSTPLTTVSSTDLGGGEYGGPLLNSSLQLVGIVVDGNVQSAAGSFLFLPDRMRTVSVDVRGVLAGLSSIYGAESLVEEMTAAESPTQ